MKTNTQTNTNEKRVVVFEIVHRVEMEITDPLLSADVPVKQFADELRASSDNLNAWPPFWADGSQVFMGYDDDGATAFTANRPEGTKITACQAFDLRGSIQTVVESDEHPPMIEDHTTFESVWKKGEWEGLRRDDWTDEEKEEGLML